MSIDVSQFLDTFYEESFEGLDIMESELLELDVGAADQDSINTIFRAAHSIKGGSGTFGLNAVASFTHVLETLLDEMRDGKRNVTQPAVDLMLTSVDVLREMLNALKTGQDIDAEHAAEVQQQLERLLKGGEEPDNDVSGVDHTSLSDHPEVMVGSGWHIRFKPLSHLFKTGNDPVRLFEELSDLGTIQVKVNDSGLPSFADIDPEDCFLSWEIEYIGDADEAQIRDVFAWVDDDCELELTIIGGEQKATTVETVAVAPVAAPASKTTAPAAPAPVAKAAAVAAAQPKEAPPIAPPKTEEKSAVARKAAPPSTESGSIRVGIDKVDALINMVGELVITQSMLNQLGEDFTMDKVQRLQEGLAELEHHTRELQENVMRIRMLPISFAFNRFPRLVHDLSQKMGKNVELKLSGENTELDKTVMEKIGDPLVHLVRNALDHGIEKPEVRASLGKPAVATLHLNAYHQGGNIVIEISDDGAGLNTEKIKNKAIEKGLINAGDELSAEKVNELIFYPGFSTADQISDVSGRGVGMDVVKKNIKDLSGAIEVLSIPGKGSRFTIRLPLTLAILDGQLVRLGDQTYIVPLVSIIESLQIRKENVKSIASDSELYRLRDEYVPILRLHKVFNTKCDNKELINGLLVVVEGDGQLAGIFVDDLLGQQQVVIKSLESNFKRVDGLSGATILGDGTVALILDIPGLVKLSKERIKKRAAASAAA